MMDIVERLRTHLVTKSELNQAADEIERLRNIIHDMTKPSDEGMTQEDYEAIYGWGGQDWNR